MIIRLGGNRHPLTASVLDSPACRKRLKYRRPGEPAMNRPGPPVKSPHRTDSSLPLRAALAVCLLACGALAARAANPETKAADPEPETVARALAARIDAVMEKHWQSAGVTPAAPVDDAAFLRRVTLDLAGRIPTRGEAVAFAEDLSPDRRAGAIRRLLESPEYALHMGRVLDEIIQGRYIGDAEFLSYLRTAVAARRGWDEIFRDILLGPWD